MSSMYVYLSVLLFSAFKFINFSENLLILVEIYLFAKSVIEKMTP